MNAMQGGPGKAPIWPALVPLAAYFLAIGLLHLRRRPSALAGGWDAVGVSGAVAAAVVLGPIDLLLPASIVGAWRWVLAIGCFFLLVVTVQLASRPRLVVYNVSIEQLRPIVARVATALDPLALGRGNRRPAGTGRAGAPRRPWRHAQREPRDARQPDESRGVGRIQPPAASSREGAAGEPEPVGRTVPRRGPRPREPRGPARVASATHGGGAVHRPRGPGLACRTTARLPAPDSRSSPCRCTSTSRRMRSPSPS